MQPKIIYSQKNLPLFQNMVYPGMDVAKAAKLGDVELIQSPETGHVYNHLFNPDLLDYDENYQNEQAHSQFFQSHLEDILEKVVRHFGNMKGIEVGCGKGHFYDMMKKKNLDVRGYDPAYQGNDPNIIKSYYNAIDEDEKPDYLIFRHVLEHIHDPWSYLHNLSKDSKSGTLIYIEVPSFDWIVENHAFYDIFYEHCNYFTLPVLKSAFGKVIDGGYSFNGQYISFFADLSTFRKPKSEDVPVYDSLDFNGYLEKIISNCRPESPLYIWGAGAKGMTFGNLLFKKQIKVEALIDINPVKQNKHVGMSGINIIPPSEIKKENAPNIVVMNPNYLNEIKAIVSDDEVNFINVL